jgi:hypothetical protein
MERNVRRDTTDPDISATGRIQCKNSAESFEDLQHITHIISSPLTRTISTAFLSFPKVVERGVQVILIPDLKTQFGKSVKELRETYGMSIDVSRLPNGRIPSSYIRKSSTRLAVEGRMASFLK